MKQIVFGLTLLILLGGLANGLLVSLGTPSWTFRGTDEEPLSIGDEVNGFVKVLNKNEFDVTISLFPEDDLLIVFEGNDSVELEPDGIHFFNYTVTLSKPGTTGSYIQVMYDSGSESYSMIALLTFVDVQGEDAPLPTTTTTTPSSGGGSVGGTIPISVEDDVDEAGEEDKEIDDEVETDETELDETEAEPINETTTATIPPTEVEEVDSGISLARIILIVGIVLGLIFTLYLIYFWIWGKDKKSDEESEFEYQTQ